MRCRPEEFYPPQLPQLTLTVQFVEQRLRILQIGGVEAFSEPVIDFGVAERRVSRIFNVTV